RVLICDLSIFPPARFKNTVEHYLPEYEHVSTIIMEKVEESVDKKEGVSIVINRISDQNEDCSNRITAFELTPKLLTNVYRIFKYGYNSQTRIQVPTDDHLTNIILN